MVEERGDRLPSGRRSSSKLWGLWSAQHAGLAKSRLGGEMSAFVIVRGHFKCQVIYLTSSFWIFSF